MKTRNLFPCLLTLAALLTVLTAVSPAAPPGEPPADDRTYWTGRSPATGSSYSFRHNHGRNWTVTLTSQGETSFAPLTEVTRCQDFVELQLRSTRLRLTSDALLKLSKPDGWSDMAKGTWSRPPLPLPTPDMIPRLPQPTPSPN
jgi:hypothetical protein